MIWLLVIIGIGVCLFVCFLFLCVVTLPNRHFGCCMHLLVDVAFGYLRPPDVIILVYLPTGNSPIREEES